MRQGENWQDVFVLIGIGMYIRFRTCTDVLLQFSRLASVLYLISTWCWNGT